MRRIDKEEVRRNLIELRQLTLEVTDDCNLSCRYCGYGEMYEWYDERQSKYLRFGQIEKLLDFLTGLWNSNESVSSNPHTFISFYGGEPLLNMPLIRQVVDYMEQSPAGRRFRYSMTTNAVCLDKEMDYLVEKYFHLLVSLDGDSYANSYRVRKDGRASFGKVVKNISLLRERYPDFYERNVSFNSVLHDRNSVGGIRKFFLRNGIGRSFASGRGGGGNSRAIQCLFRQDGTPVFRLRFAERLWAMLVLHRGYARGISRLPGIHECGGFSKVRILLPFVSCGRSRLVSEIDAGGRGGMIEKTD